MKKLKVIFVIAALFIGATARWPSPEAGARSVELPGPVMKAHFIDVGQANATLLEFKCGAVLIDAGEDQEHEEALVEFLNRFFDDRPALDRTIKLGRASRIAQRDDRRTTRRHDAEYRSAIESGKAWATGSDQEIRSF